MDEETLELRPTPATDDELWEHRLYQEDAYDVIDVGDYKVFPDKEEGRKRVIGPDRGGRILTFIIQKSTAWEGYWIITGWPSAPAEVTLFKKQGGTKHG